MRSAVTYLLLLLCSVLAGRIILHFFLFISSSSVFVATNERNDRAVTVSTQTLILAVNVSP